MPPVTKFNIGATSMLNKGDALAAFIRDELSSDITTVPGIGPASAAKLAAAGVNTTYQLFGQFLLLKAEKATSQEHMDAVYAWLAGTGITAQRSAIAFAVASKALTWMPGVFKMDELDPATE